MIGLDLLKEEIETLKELALLGTVSQVHTHAGYNLFLNISHLLRKHGYNTVDDELWGFIEMLPVPPPSLPSPETYTKNDLDAYIKTHHKLFENDDHQISTEFEKKDGYMIPKYLMQYVLSELINNGYNREGTNISIKFTGEKQLRTIRIDSDTKMPVYPSKIFMARYSEKLGGGRGYGLWLVKENLNKRRWGIRLSSSSKDGRVTFFIRELK